MAHLSERFANRVAQRGFIYIIIRFLLIDSHLEEGSATVEFDFSQIREYGKPINGFGGVASGPEPLKQGLDGIRDILTKRAQSDNPLLTSVDITDIMNIIGKIENIGKKIR